MSTLGFYFMSLGPTPSTAIPLNLLSKLVFISRHTDYMVPSTLNHVFSFATTGPSLKRSFGLSPCGASPKVEESSQRSICPRFLSSTMMDVVRSRSSKFISTLPVRLYRALPAVILGTLINVLDTVSTGILLFPTEDGVFRSLQLQGLSMFIVSGLTSQLAMTAGGSRFPGALGAMLIEILPFLRGVATDIRAALGDTHPGLIPTVMAAYALTSFLTGAAFLILGLLKLGNLVAYFPQTVLTGAIGAIGLSLFVLGLGLPFPPSATPLSLSNVASTLFSRSHLGLLAASFFPALILSVTLRSRHIELWTRGLIRSAYYIPVYLLVIPAVFWIAVRAVGVPKEDLIATGWLFTVDSVSASSSSSVKIAASASWNYWTLFDFRLVEWRSLKSAIQNIVLLVVIGVLNLPIYVPTLAFTLDVSYDMNHELLGHGAANIFAGLVGTVPNILQYSYSVYFSRAKGGRFELSLVILLMGALFFTAGHLLPYVPTILASTLVLFIGVELFLEAVWEASKTLAWMEYAVVMGTLVGCTFLGFAEGFGVGIGAATVVYLMYGVIDSPARVTRWNEWNELQQAKNQDEHHVATPLEGRLPLPRSHTPAPIMLGEHQSVAVADHKISEATEDVLQQLNARVCVLSGYIFFASVPSLERVLLRPGNTHGHPAFFILDLGRAHRIETAAARVLVRCARELRLKGCALVVCGVRMVGGLHADLVRAEVPLVFDGAAVGDVEAEVNLDGNESVAGRGIPAFETRAACLAWCAREHARPGQEGNSEGLGDDARDRAFETFRELFGFEVDAALGAPGGDDTVPAGDPTSPVSEVTRFVEAGGRITAYLPGQVICRQGITFVVEGEIDLVAVPSAADASSVLRPSIHRLLAMLPRETLRAVRTRLPSFSQDDRARARHVKSGEVLDCRVKTHFSVANTRSVVVEIEGEILMAWARAKLDGLVHNA
ncbi:sulfate transporter family-domain-containing protein [Mycena capillaripes]|nr:sulfate transporter family-domain-containing protein [Mycena capillaripes]